MRDLVLKSPLEYKAFNIFFEDESRFGLLTRNGSMLTAKGVKPICSFQQVFETTYLYGAFSAINGDMFLLELPTCNAANFQLFLDEFSKHNPQEYKIIVLDNGAFHKAKSLHIPPNMVLLFLPPYSPELNGAEKIWQRMKRNFTNKLFKTLEDLSCFIEAEVRLLTAEIVKATCNYFWISSSLI